MSFGICILTCKHVFLSKANAAANRIKKAIELSQMSDQLCDTYNTLFSNLKDWIEKKKVDFEVSH